MTIETTIKDSTIELKLGSKINKIAVEDATEIIVALLAARKEAYGNLRTVREEAAKAAKAEREATKVAKLQERKAKLEEQLAALAA
jgi:Ribonuclease G/E